MAYPFRLLRWLARVRLARFLPVAKRLTRGGSAFLHYYGDRVLAAPFEELQRAAEFQELHGPDAINLAIGAPRFDLVPSGSTKLPADRRGWPPAWGLPELRQVVAEKFDAHQGLAVNPHDEVLVTLGAAGAFNLIADAFLNPGERVVLFDPASPLYSFVCRQRRLRIRWLASWMEKGRTCFHLDQLARALRGARLIVVNSPANPTGGIVAAEDLEQIAWWANRRDALILSDDVFERFRYEGGSAGIAQLPKARGRTLTIGSVSKSHALAAARVGWLAGHRHLVRPCALTAVLQGMCVPTLSQQIALTALRQDADVLQCMRAELDSRRRYAFERLQAVGLTPAWPAGAFFLWVPVQELGLSGQAFAERLREEKRVLVTPGELFGPSGAAYVRVSYATEDGRLREGLARMADFIRELQADRLSEAKQAA